MNDFYTTLNYVNKMIYEPNDLTVKSIQEEKQNSKYSAGTFRLSSRTVRFRVANITPTKVGQFVAFWEKVRIIKTNLLHMREHLMYSLSLLLKIIGVNNRIRLLNKQYSTKGAFY